MTNNTHRDRLNSLYKKFNLQPEDTFKEASQGWTIIKRAGIDKIQAAAEIDIEYHPIVIEREFAVIKAVAKMADKKIETFGEADRKLNCRQTYPVAMAEKRAMGRAVLKLSGFYSLGHFSEDEADWTKSTL